MTSSSSPTEDLPNHAKELFVQFLSDTHTDIDAEFESLCLEHPDTADELRRLYSASKNLEEQFAFFGSRSDGDDSSTGDGARTNDTIGDFELIRRIASGGQGEVWEAQQRSLNRRVALKLVLPGRINEKSLTLFAREARAGGRLAHPGIVAVFGYGQDNGRHWIAQELVEGSWTLRDFIDEMRNADELPRNYYRSVAGFLAALADALQAAHEAGVIHRDVKPQNVLVTKDDQPKLTDFGLARITDEAAMSVTGDFAGTWLYMSPEQVTAKRIELDHRTDVFSLGVVMYETLALSRPFDGDTTHQIAEKILMWDPPDLTKIRSKVPKDLAVICGKALEKRKDARYSTMTEFALDLRRWLSNESIHATAPRQVDRAAKWCKRNPTKSVAIGLASVFVVAISSLLWANVESKRELEVERKNLTMANQALSNQKSKDQRRVVELEKLNDDNRRLSLTQKEMLEVTGELLIEKQENLTALQTTLVLAEQRSFEVLRLSAVQDMEELVSEVDELWPAIPSMVPRLSAWVERSGPLVGHSGLNRQVLARLRGEDELNPGLMKLPETAVQRFAGGENASQIRAGGDLVAAQGVCAKCHMNMREGQQAAKGQLWWESQLSKLNEGVTDIQNSLLAAEVVTEEYGWSVMRRLRFAAKISELSMVGPEPSRLWNEAVSLIATSPKYNGLALMPQLGLLPIGPDPVSGLGEFAH
ncbi:MAG: serine/threonine protein kinase, partial [Planctomycetota bacterium]